MQTTTLNESEWQAEREAATQRFFGLSADEFVQDYEAGKYPDDDLDGLMQVLMLFPELA